MVRSTDGEWAKAGVHIQSVIHWFTGSPAGTPRPLFDPIAGRHLKEDEMAGKLKFLLLIQ